MSTDPGVGRALLLLALAACTHEPSRGGEREPCRAGSSCDRSLTCLSDRCVWLPAPIPTIPATARAAPTAPTAPIAPPTIASGPSGLPPECVAYAALLDRYATCKGLPADARTAIAGVVAQLHTNWAQLGSAVQPPAVADACRQGTAAIQQALVQFGC